VRGVCDTGTAPALESFEPAHEVACVRAREIERELKLQVAS
jgi:hypothetical protein